MGGGGYCRDLYASYIFYCAKMRICNKYITNIKWWWHNIEWTWMYSRGVYKHRWQGLAIVLSSLSAGVPCFSGLGECFLWGRDKIFVWKRLQVNLVVCRGGLGREYAVVSIWRWYLHMYVVLCITVSVSLFSVPFLECALRVIGDRRFGTA